MPPHPYQRGTAWMGSDFETLVERKIKAAQKDGGLSRDAVIEEVVADACEMVLGNSKAIDRLAKEKPGLAKRITDWLHEFFADIRKAFDGVEARHEEAKAMLDYMDELTKLWDDAMVEVAENRGSAQKSSSVRNGSKNSIRESFYVEIDNWDGKAEKTFRVGKTSDILKSIGVRDTEIIWHSIKIAAILRKHTNMTKEVIKQVPKILENPIIVLASKNIDSRLAMFGTVTDSNGKPVTAILELQPTSRGGQVMDFSVIASAYGKDNAKGLVESSGLVYIDPNKNRTESWLQGLGLQLPSDTTALGSVGRITYPDGKVKIDSIPYTQYMQTGSENVNGKLSRRDSAEGLTKEEARAQAAAYTRLKAENAELRRRVEYWKGQTRRTKQATVRQTDVNRFARQLIKRYGSTADQAYIRQALQEMGDYLVQNDGEALDFACQSKLRNKVIDTEPQMG